MTATVGNEIEIKGSNGRKSPVGNDRSGGSARPSGSPARAGAVQRWRFVLVVGSAPGGPPASQLWQRVTSCVLADALVIEEPFGPMLRIRFDRSAPTRAEAIASAIRSVEAVGLWALRVDHDDWVTVGDVAHRIGRSRETVRLWATNQSGPGGFPPPANPRRDTTFYSWVEVLVWLRERLELDLPEQEPALVAANLVVQLRALLPRVSRAGAILDLLSEPGSVQGTAGPS